MWKRKTRKKLIEALNNLVKFSSLHPISKIRFSMVNEYGMEDLDSRFCATGMDDILGVLMDKSLTCRIARIRSEDFMFHHGTLISFLLLPTSDLTTNIDAEMLELVAKLNMSQEEDCSETGG